MKFQRYIIFLFVIFPLSAINSMANITVSGVVTEDENKPMEFVTVRVSGTAIGTMTDVKGKYTMSIPENDTIKIIFSSMGYDKVEQRLIDAKGDVTLNVKMQKKARELNEVEVRDFRKQTDNIQKLDANALRLSPDVSGGSVEALISTMPGVHSNNELSSQYSVRGGNFDENSVYINGVEVYRPQLINSGQQEGLSIINPDLVGSIGFSSGGFGVEYGDKMSSVLDIQYRQPQSFGGAVSLSLMGGGASIGMATKKFSMLHGLRYKRNNSLLSSLETKGEYNPSFFDYQTYMTYKITPKFEISLLGNIALNAYNFTPSTRTTKFGTSTTTKEFKVYFDGDEKDRFETYFGALSLDYRRSKNTMFTGLVSAYLTNELVAYDINGEYWLNQASDNGDSGTVADNDVQGVGSYHEHARNRLKASVVAMQLKGTTRYRNNEFRYGLTYQHEAIHDRTREWESRDSAGYSLPHNPGSVNVIYNIISSHDMSSNRAQMYMQDTYRLPVSAGYFTFNGGLRMSYWDFNKEFLLSPRASIGFVPSRNENLTLRFATGLYYQSPFYKEYRDTVRNADGNYIVQLNNKIKSQRSFQFVLGGDYVFRTFDRPFKFTTEIYYKLLNNLITYEVDNMRVWYSGKNDAKGYATGIDFKLFGQFVPGTDSWISLSFMRTRETRNGVSVPRPSDQRYSLAVFFSDYVPKLPKIKFYLRGIFADGLTMTAPGKSRDEYYFRAPSYKRVDVGLSYAIIGGEGDDVKNHRGFARYFKNMWVGVDVFNLLDISNVNSYYWVTDVSNVQYAVPNYLTRRQFNIKLSVEF